MAGALAGVCGKGVRVEKSAGSLRVEKMHPVGSSLRKGQSSGHYDISPFKELVSFIIEGVTMICPRLHHLDHSNNEIQGLETYLYHSAWQQKKICLEELNERPNKLVRGKADQVWGSNSPILQVGN